MKKTSFTKIILREFMNSKARFFSIVIMIALGVFVLVGLKVTGPNMRSTGNNFFKQHHLADAVITSNYGITKEDEKWIKNLKNVDKVSFGYSTDALIQNSKSSVRIFSLSRNISSYNVTEGQLPRKEDEIALSNREKGKYKIGQQITFTNNNHKKISSILKKSTYKITGFVDSAEYIKKGNLGNTKLGTGQLSTFGIVPEKGFHMEVHSIARLTFKNTKGLSGYSDLYLNRMDRNIDKIKNKLQKHSLLRTKKLKDEIQSKVDITQKKVDQAETQLRIGEQKIAAAKSKRSTIQFQLTQLSALGQGNSVAATKLKTTEQQLTKNINAFDAQKSEIKKEIALGHSKIKQTKSLLDHFSNAEYTMMDRNDFVAGYSIYGEDADRIYALSDVFPIFFFAVAILVSLSTMSRMVQEQRIQIGTLKALGYGRIAIINKYVIYGGFAGIFGAIIGAIFGHIILPKVIFNAYAANFIFPKIQISIIWEYILYGVIISILCTTIPAIFAIQKDLKENAADLMRPKAPKAGSRILFERFHFIWNRLSFSHKVTARNLFLYKSRMFMTVFGVAGCTALMIAGFGIKDSLSGIVNTQYKDILHYDLLSVYNINTSKNHMNNYLKTIQLNPEISDHSSVHYELVTAKQNGGKKQKVTLIVPKEKASFHKFITVKDRVTGNKLNLNNQGVIISEKLAKLYGLKPGDTFTIKNSDNKNFHLKVTGISEMYVGHYMYTTDQYYKKAFDHQADFNAKMIKLKHRDNATINHVSQQLLKKKAATAIIQTNEVKKSINNILNGLNHVVIVIIVNASLLAFVVLYNLTNINVSERIRELSTIKVLGFFPFEVTMYIYRETLTLTMFGILFGFIGGFALHKFIIQTLPPENSMFDPELLWTNFTTSAVLTFFFSVVVMYLMHRKIEKVNMLEALKAVD